MSKYRNEIKKQQSEQAKKERMKLALGASAVILAGGGIVGFAIYQNHQNLYGTYCKVGNHELSRIEYEFFYNSTVNNFLSSYSSYLSAFGLDTSKPFSEQEYSEGVTWEQYFQEQTLELLKEVLILSDAANEAGFKLDEKTYTDFYKNAEETSKEYELTLDEYIKQMYGSNATKKNIEDTLRMYFLAADYAEHLQTTDLLPSDKEIEEYYNNNKDDYDKVTYRVFAVQADPSLNENLKEDNKEDTQTENNTESLQASSSEENKETSTEQDLENESKSEETEYTDEDWEIANKNAENKANEFFEQVYDEETFKELCVKYASEEQKSSYEKDDISLQSNILKSNMTPCLADWLMDETREKDATAVIEDPDSNTYYIVYFLERQRDDTPTVDVRHILIAPESIEPIKEDATEEEKQEYDKKVEEADKTAKEKAEQLFKDWKADGATEEGFAKLANANSSDGAEGGLYKEVSQGEMVSEFNDWIFDKTRKSGDTDIVKTDYGYHIMYYVGQNAPEWQVNIKYQLTDEAYQDFVARRIDNYNFEDVKGELTKAAENKVSTTITTSEQSNDGISEINSITSEEVNNELSEDDTSSKENSIASENSSADDITVKQDNTTTTNNAINEESSESTSDEKTSSKKTKAKKESKKETKAKETVNKDKNSK